MPLKPGMRGDGGRVQHPRRSLHHRPERNAGNEGRHRVEIGRRGDLGDQDRIDLRAAGNRPAQRQHVFAPPRRVEPVDPNDPRPVAEIGLGEDPGEKRAGGDLLLRRDGILEVEDDRVAVESLRLLQRPLLRAGDVEHRTIGARTVVSGWHESLLAT